jgi:hypothetical protein
MPLRGPCCLEGHHSGPRRCQHVLHIEPASADFRRGCTPGLLHGKLSSKAATGEKRKKTLLRGIAPRAMLYCSAGTGVVKVPRCWFDVPRQEAARKGDLQVRLVSLPSFHQCTSYQRNVQNSSFSGLHAAFPHGSHAAGTSTGQ